MGYWVAVDRPGELGKVKRISEYDRYHHRQTAEQYRSGAQALHDEMSARHEASTGEPLPPVTVRVWPVTSDDFANHRLCGIKRGWPAKRNRVELAQALAEGRFTPTAVPQSPVPAREKPLPDCSPYKPWSKVREQKEIVGAAVAGSFTPSPAYLEKHPAIAAAIVTAKAATRSATEPATKPTVKPKQVRKPRRVRRAKPVSRKRSYGRVY